jgi:hypothetical protein
VQPGPCALVVVADLGFGFFRGALIDDELTRHRSCDARRSRATASLIDRLFA